MGGSAVAVPFWYLSRSSRIAVSPDLVHARRPSLYIPESPVGCRAPDMLCTISSVRRLDADVLPFAKPACCIPAVVRKYKHRLDFHFHVVCVRTLRYTTTNSRTPARLPLLLPSLLDNDNTHRWENDHLRPSDSPSTPPHPAPRPRGPSQDERGPARRETAGFALYATQPPYPRRNPGPKRPGAAVPQGYTNPSHTT